MTEPVPDPKATPDASGRDDGGRPTDAPADAPADALADTVTSAAAPRALSPSGASTFRQCARRWKLRYVDKLADPPGEPALRGTFVHRVLEDLMAIAPSGRTLERARAICRDLWPTMAQDPDFVALELPADSQRDFRWSAWHDVEGYFALVDPSQIDVVDRELDVNASLDGVPFRGVVDLVERVADGWRISDYKTGRAPSDRFVDSRLAQVWLYAAALNTGGADVREVRLLYLGHSGGRDRDRQPTEIARQFDPDAAADAVAEHRLTWDRIGEAVATDRFDPTPGPLCSWCPYRDDCPEGQAEHQRRNGLAA